MTDDRQYFEPEIETMPRAQLGALQQDRLLEQTEYAYERSGLIRTTWDAAKVHPRDIKSIDDFRERAPFITKNAIRRYRDEHNDPYGGLLCIEPSELTTIMSTSGTTGDATLFSKQWTECLPEARDLARHLWATGCRPGDFGTYMSLTIRGPLFEAFRLLGAVPVMFEHSPAELRRFCEVSLELRPTVLYLLSGPMIATLEEIAETVDLADVFSSYRGVIFGGEPLGRRARGVLAEWGVRPFMHTSNCDVGFASGCTEHDGGHVWEDIAFTEHLDPDGSAFAAPSGGEGELVATALVDKAAPLIRYRSDDIVRYTEEPCPCGRTHARIWPLGRRGDEIVVAGKRLLPLQIWPAIEQVRETSAGLFQIIRARREMDTLALRVGYRAGPTTIADLRTRVAEAVLAEVGVEPTVELVPNEDLLKLGPPHKIPRMTER